MRLKKWMYWMSSVEYPNICLNWMPSDPSNMRGCDGISVSKQKWVIGGDKLHQLVQNTLVEEEAQRWIPVFWYPHWRLKSDVTYVKRNIQHNAFPPKMSIIKLLSMSNWCPVSCAAFGWEMTQRCNCGPTLCTSEILPGGVPRYCHIVICLWCPWAGDDPEMHWWSTLPTINGIHCRLFTPPSPSLTD